MKLKTNIQESTLTEKKQIKFRSGRSNGSLSYTNIVPDNIRKFADRNGLTSIVKKVAVWNVKLTGRGVIGGTAIGKNYDTLVLDLFTYNGSDCYIYAGKIKVNDIVVNSYLEFKKAFSKDYELVDDSGKVISEDSRSRKISPGDSVRVTYKNVDFGNQGTVVEVIPGYAYVIFSGKTDRKKIPLQDLVHVNLKEVVGNTTVSDPGYQTPNAFKKNSNIKNGGEIESERMGYKKAKIPEITESKLNKLREHIKRLIAEEFGYEIYKPKEKVETPTDDEGKKPKEVKKEEDVTYKSEKDRKYETHKGKPLNTVKLYESSHAGDFDKKRILNFFNGTKINCIRINCLRMHPIYLYRSQLSKIDSLQIPYINIISVETDPKIKENINEMRYNDYKQYEGVSQKKKVNMAMHEVSSALYEIDRFLGQNAKLMKEEKITEDQYWKSTCVRMAKINERMKSIKKKLNEFGLANIMEKLEERIKPKSCKIKYKGKEYFIYEKDYNDPKITQLFLYLDDTLQSPVKFASGTGLVKKANIEYKLKEQEKPLSIVSKNAEQVTTVKEAADPRFDRFTLKVDKKDDIHPGTYKGTIKRSAKGWMLYDKSNSPEEAGPFNSIKSLLDYYDLDKRDLSGEYVKNLREDSTKPSGKLKVINRGKWYTDAEVLDMIPKKGVTELQKLDLGDLDEDDIMDKYNAVLKKYKVPVETVELAYNSDNEEPDDNGDTSDTDGEFQFGDNYCGFKLKSVKR